MNYILKLFLLICTLFSTACGDSDPQPIQFGKDGCDFCKMTIMDPKFGAELITSKGKVFKFDDVNCLIQYMDEIKESDRSDSRLYVIDFHAQKVLIDATSARYIKSVEVRSPMASGIAAFSNEIIQKEYEEKWEGDTLLWADLVQMYSSRQ